MLAPEVLVPPAVLPTLFIPEGMVDSNLVGLKGHDQVIHNNHQCICDGYRSFFPWTAFLFVIFLYAMKFMGHVQLQHKVLQGPFNPGICFFNDL